MTRLLLFVPAGLVALAWLVGAVRRGCAATSTAGVDRALADLRVRSGMTSTRSGGGPSRPVPGWSQREPGEWS